MTRASSRFGAQRVAHGNPADDRSVRAQHQAASRTTDLDTLRSWENLVAWFLAQLAVPTGIGYGHILDEQTRRPGDVLLTRADGSWCEVSERIDDGVRQVREAGPTLLWRAVENAHRLWHELGEPGWERFGLTVARDHQWVWLDALDGDHTWPLRNDNAEIMRRVEAGERITVTGHADRWPTSSRVSVTAPTGPGRRCATSGRHSASCLRWT